MKDTFKEKSLSKDKNSQKQGKSELTRQLERSVANYYLGIKGDLGFQRTWEAENSFSEYLSEYSLQKREHND